eukprot:GHVR01086863.1.p1 GENE.GHVR01086863.1~~GHVR01086863.1.p1  ORF type:complete len:321 (-),score=26.77 GHVR01086863.1:100-1062(-)
MQNFFFRIFVYCIDMVFYWSMFDSKYRVREEFIRNPDKLEKHLKIIGLIAFICWPLFLLPAVVLPFLKHAQDLRNASPRLIRRHFNAFAKWKFRLFNELPHLFHSRVDLAEDATEEYVSSMSNSLSITLLCDFSRYVLGSIFAVLVAIAFLDERVMHFLHVGGKNLWCYLPVFGVLVTVLVPSTKQKNMLCESCGDKIGSGPDAASPMQQYLLAMRMCQFTLYPLQKLTDSLRSLASRPEESPVELHNAIKSHLQTQFFQRRIAQLRDEVIAVVLAPWAFYNCMFFIFYSFVIVNKKVQYIWNCAVHICIHVCVYLVCLV